MKRGLRTLFCSLILITGCSQASASDGSRTAANADATPTAQKPDPIAPLVDHHQHLLSSAAAALLNDPPPLAEPLPQDVMRLLQDRAERWNDRAALADLYTEGSIVLGDFDPCWIRGRTAVADYLSTRFARPFRLTPIAYTSQGSAAHIAGYFTRGEGPSTRHFGYFYMALNKGADGAWRVAVENDTFPGPPRQEPITAEQLVAMLDAAGIRRAVVLSEGFWFDGPKVPAAEAYPKVRAENDWTAQQVAQFPDRLVAFCSFNPLNDYALTELDRCASSGRFKGLKLHFNTSGVDLKNPRHVERVRRVFEAANKRRLPIVVHVRADQSYGREHAEILLHQLVAAAPDIPVQIAHLWGGENFSDSALAAYADAVAAGDPATRNLYFDVAEAALVAGDSNETLQLIAKRIRQIGPKRILYGSDAALNGRLQPRDAWVQFREKVPLTEAEFRTIANNVAPYLE